MNRLNTCEEVSVDSFAMNMNAPEKSDFDRFLFVCLSDTLFIQWLSIWHSFCRTSKIFIQEESRIEIFADYYLSDIRDFVYDKEKSRIFDKNLNKVVPHQDNIQDFISDLHNQEILQYVTLLKHVISEITTNDDIHSLKILDQSVLMHGDGSLSKSCVISLPLTELLVRELLVTSFEAKCVLYLENFKSYMLKLFDQKVLVSDFTEDSVRLVLRTLLRSIVDKKDDSELTTLITEFILTDIQEGVADKELRKKNIKITKQKKKIQKKSRKTNRK